MKPLTYQTDARGRSGVYRPSPEPAPETALPAATFATEERPDGLHIVERATGHSFGIAASPAIAAGQLAALGRMAR